MPLPFIPSIPSLPEFEQAGEKLEDKLLAVLTQFRKDTIADLRSLLDEYQFTGSAGLTRKDTTK